ncbi:hypothetical protein [Sulfitobacter sp.]|uniref:hypothetical protein n=1 Tax=Sulfitobacter sp. TaxID=1903071 RepID=UPI003002CB04
MSIAPVAIISNQMSLPNWKPPSFAAIAKYRSAEKVRRPIITPFHEGMPRYREHMIGGNIDDMVAYIMSLKD